MVQLLLIVIAVWFGLGLVGGVVLLGAYAWEALRKRLGTARSS